MRILPLPAGRGGRHAGSAPCSATFSSACSSRSRRCSPCSRSSSCWRACCRAIRRRRSSAIRRAPEALAAMRHRLGVDKPIGAQYVDFLVNAVRGDWGNSLVTGKPVVEEVRKVLPYTIDLTVTAIVLGALIGVPLGVWSALRRNTWVDYVARIGSLLGLSFPGLRLGDPAAARLRHPAALVPGDQRRVARRSRRAAAQPRASGHQSRHHHGRLRHARDALVDARSAGRGLHPHGARQGRADARRHLAPRASATASFPWSRSSASISAS